MEKIIDYFKIYFSMPAWGPFVFETTFFMTLTILFNKDRGLDKGKTWITIVYETILLWVVMFSFRVLRYAFFSGFGLSLVIALGVVVIIYGCIKGRKKIKISLFYSLLFAAFSLYLTSFTQAIPDFFYMLAGLDTPTSAAGLSSAIASPIMSALLLIMCLYFPLERYERISWKLIIVPILLVLVSFFVQMYNIQITELLDKSNNVGQGTIEQSKRVLIFYIGTILYTLITMGYAFCYLIAKNAAKSRNLDNSLATAKQYAEQSENVNNIIQANLEEMRSLRHDMNNQLSYMQIMMSQKDYTKLEEYFEEFNKNMPDSLEFCDTDNTVIRNVIGLEQYKAKQRGIKIVPTLRVEAKLNIIDSDLTAVLLNLIDNAIEAIELDQIKNATIQVSIVEKDKFLFINVTNPVTDDKNTESRKNLKTLKGDETLHGRGTKIINKIAVEYNGLFEHKIEDGQFIADVMMSLLGKEEN